MEKAWESPPTPSATWEHNQKMQTLPDTKSVGFLILGFLASHTMKIKFGYLDLPICNILL